MKLVALVVLLSLSSLTLTEVVTSFRGCNEFFIHRRKNEMITPTVFTTNNYKMICQRWNNKYRYATLYDTERRIPVYSAYTFINAEHRGRNVEWKNEPQLENMRDSQDMREILKAEMDVFIHQAVNRDYTTYTRGHVFPNQYAADDDQAESTFSFTNVAPQTDHSNNRWAAQVETPMRAVIVRECQPNRLNPAYIVTGVIPGNKWIPITRNVKGKIKEIDQGVNIPSYYWTAFCCINNNNNVRVSRAYMSLQNQPDQTYELREMSVNMLNRRLSELYGKDFTVFGQLCLT